MGALAGVVELVDTQDLGSCAFGRESSSLFSCTIGVPQRPRTVWVCDTRVSVTNAPSPFCQEIPRWVRRRSTWPVARTPYSASRILPLPWESTSMMKVERISPLMTLPHRVLSPQAP